MSLYSLAGSGHAGSGWQIGGGLSSTLTSASDANYFIF